MSRAISLTVAFLVLLSGCTQPSIDQRPVAPSTAVALPAATPLPSVSGPFTPAATSLPGASYPTPSPQLSPSPTQTDKSPIITTAPAGGPLPAAGRATLTPAPPASSPTAVTPVSPSPVLTPTVAPLAFVAMTVTLPFSRTGEVLVHPDQLLFTARAPGDAQAPLPNALFAQDIKGGEPAVLAVSHLGPRGLICCLDASQNWITWLSYAESGGDWRLYVRSLRSGSEQVVDSEVDTGVVMRGTTAAVSDNRLVWTAYRLSPSGEPLTAVFLLDLDTGRRRQLAQATPPEALGPVDIEGDRVVWSKGISADGRRRSNVYLFDLAGGGLRQLTQDGVSGQPKISGRHVVWRQGFEDTGPIVIYDLPTRTQTHLSASGDFLQLGDGLLTWRAYLPPIGAYVYDLASNTMDGLASNDWVASYHVTGRVIPLVSSFGADPSGPRRVQIRTYQPTDRRD